MITDALLQLNAAKATIRAAATYVSVNTIDLSVNRDIGAGEGLKVLWNIETAFAGGTAIQFQQILSATENLGSPVVVDNGVTVPLANLLVGAMIVRAIPELLGSPAGVTAPVAGVAGIGSTGLRYYGTQEVSTGTFTLGTLSTRIIKDVINVKHHPGGYSIL